MLLIPSSCFFNFFPIVSNGFRPCPLGAHHWLRTPGQPLCIWVLSVVAATWAPRCLHESSPMATCALTASGSPLGVLVNHGFYICFSPPARWGLLDFIRAVVLLLLLRLLLQFLLDHVCINFHLHFRLANSSPSSSPTSELSAHCWTSTWDLPSSVRTAGPQPGTFPAQCAPLDLNLGPSQLSAHRWTSTAR